MKNKFIKWICSKDFAYKLAIKLIANRIVHEQNILTPQYLIDRGWVEKDGFYVESNVKNRDMISISFEKTWYRVWHSEKRTFIALESKIEWFENYCLLLRNEERYELSNV